MTRPNLRTLVAVLVALLVASSAMLAAPGRAHAHTGDQSYLYLDVADDDLRGQVEMPYRDLRSVFGVTLEGSDDDIVAELEANYDTILVYLQQHVSIGDTTAPWDLQFDGVLTLTQAYEEADSGVYAVFPFVVDLQGATVPQELEVQFDPFVDEIDGRDALLLIANDWQRGVFDNEAESLVRFHAGQRTAVVDLGEASQWNNFTESIELGVDHIKTGPDHIFFVLVLLLPSVLVFAVGRWAPTRTFGSSLWRVLKIVTMFTVAHSITFTLAGLDILPLPPSRLIESVIAASIAAAALHNLKPIGANKEWLIAFAFGLFHGMGFASLVSDLEVSKTTQLVSLLGRNVGIEIGQAFVVLVMFPGLFLLRRTAIYRPFFRIGSIVLALVSLGWMLERIFDADVRTSKVVDNVMEFPRVMWLVLAFNALAATVWWWQRSQDRLMPVHGDEPLDSLDHSEAGTDDSELEPVG